MPKGHYPRKKHFEMPLLLERVQAGWRVRQLAKLYGCSDTSVAYRLRSMGVVPSSYRGSVGAANGSWKGGKAHSGPYVYVKAPTGHPYATKAGRVLEHRLVMERHLGRYLLPTEVVHHKKGYLNKLSNLVLYKTNGKHLAETLRGKCPRWTEDGKRRISEGVRQAAARRRAPIRVRLETRVRL